MSEDEKRQAKPEQAKPEPNAYRRWYSTLHPSLQLIGMQLWMPIFFIVMFCVCYVAAFHAPIPHNAPVAIVGGTSQVNPQAAGSQAARGQATASLHGTIRLIDYGSLDRAKSDVLHGAVAAAYDPSSATLYVAAAHQYQASSFIPVLLKPLFAAQPSAVKTVNLAPLPAYDSFGMTAMYLMLAWCIGGYMTAMFIGLMGAPLMHRTRVAVIVGLGLIISVVTNILAGPIIGAIHGHFWALMLMAWGWIVAIGLTVNGLSYFFGRFVALPAMVVFVFLSVPSSGAAYPAWLMPEPFAWLNNVVVGSGITEMIKRILYGVGPGYGRGMIMMAAYAVAGIVLMLVGKRWWEYRRRRRIVAGKTSMFGEAQNANREFLLNERDKTLAKHGLESTGTGTISTIVSGRRRHEKPRYDDEDGSSGNVFIPGTSLEGDELLDRARRETAESKSHDGR